MGGRAFILGLGVCLLAGCGGGGPSSSPQAPQPGANPNPPAPPPPPAQLAGPAGARSFKSGPIQITADGRWVWVVNSDNDSVARIDTSDFSVTEFVLPDPAQSDEPRGLSVTEDGSEVWVACHDSDRIVVLRGSDGAIVATVDLPWGSGPQSVALSPDQATALVTLFRRGAVAEIDVATRTVGAILEPVWRSPMGVAWVEGDQVAWITHVLADGEHTRVTRIDCAGPDPKVAGEIIVFASDPRQSSRLAPPTDVAEGGYLTPRGHPARLPGAREVWIPMQYNNITEDRYTPDSTIQATIRRLDIDSLRLPNTNDTKVVLSALHVHEVAGNGAFVGPGWNAGVSGPIDIGFSADGQLALLCCEQSNDLVLVPTATTNVRPPGAPPLVEIPVGDRPMGVAVSPTGGAFVLNRFSRDVSAIDVDSGREVRRIPTTPVTGEPFAADVLLGAKLFHTSADPRLSQNNKVACGSCHIDNELDGRHWAFHALPGRAGPRPTLTMRGLNRHFGPRDPVTGFGQLHRSGDRDEVQDFEHTIQGDLMGGTGFLGAAAPEAMGPPMAGRSAELDAIAAYVLDLDPILRSPYRAADGSLSERAVRGAGLFLAARCDACHVPETGFVDFSFHDVGQHRPNSEEELDQGSRAPFQWHVATKTLIGIWATPNFDGVSNFEAIDIASFLDDIAQRTSHGDIRALNAQQRADLAEFLLSIDGNMTAAEVRSAADTTPPRLVRAEAASLTRIDAWFSEPVDRTTAENAANWTIQVQGGGAVAVTAAARDGQNGDRVTLTASLQKNTNYTVVPGPIRDPAGNTLSAADNSNRRAVNIGTELTITLGASGYENLAIAVHDCGTVGPGLSTWSHDRAVLSTQDNGTRNKGFVRFDWRAAFTAATAVASANDILDASFTMQPQSGHIHPVEARRCLQAWSDPATGGDWNRNADGAPTWRDHSHPNGRWNSAGANRRTAGVAGDAAAQYDGGNDTAFAPDVTAVPESITDRVRFASNAVTQAFRFWFDNPAQDYGYVLQFAPNAHRAGLLFWRHEHGLMDKGPVLTIRYRIP